MGEYQRVYKYLIHVRHYDYNIDKKIIIHYLFEFKYWWYDKI